jgi:hypothetical protein
LTIKSGFVELRLNLSYAQTTHKSKSPAANITDMAFVFSLRKQGLRANVQQ